MTSREDVHRVRVVPVETSLELVSIRAAVGDDAPAIADVHVRAWQAAYRGIIEDEYLDGLSVDEQRASCGELGEGPEIIGSDPAPRRRRTGCT